MPTYELKRRRLHRKRWVLDWQRRIPKQEDKLLKYNNKVFDVKFISWPLDHSAVIFGNR